MGRLVRKPRVADLDSQITGFDGAVQSGPAGMRTANVEATKRLLLGVRFHGVKPDEDRSIMEFINKRLSERRNRGLA